jgi:hypothetical protein
LNTASGIQQRAGADTWYQDDDQKHERDNEGQRRQPLPARHRHRECGHRGDDRHADGEQVPHQEMGGRDLVARRVGQRDRGGVDHHHAEQHQGGGDQQQRRVDALLAATDGVCRSAVAERQQPAAGADRRPTGVCPASSQTRAEPS